MIIKKNIDFSGINGYNFTELEVHRMKICEKIAFILSLISLLIGVLAKILYPMLSNITFNTAPRSFFMLSGLLILFAMYFHKKGKS